MTRNRPEFVILIMIHVDHDIENAATNSFMTVSEEITNHEWNTSRLGLPKSKLLYLFVHGTTKK
jgi:hypothetical protein